MYPKGKKDAKNRNLNNTATRLAHEFTHLLDWSASGEQANDKGGYHNIEKGNNVSINAQIDKETAYMNADNFRYWLKGV